MEEKEHLAKRVRELEWQVKQLEHDLIHDPLTGLKTRAFFEQQITPYLEILDREEEILPAGSAKRKEKFGFKNLSVIFFDIDHFKKINDTYGHDAGDAVLRKVSETINRSVRTGDTVARWGGEEIVASLLGADEDGAKHKADEIREAVEKLEFPEIPELKITISAGVASSQKDLGLGALVRRADQGLYMAKESGRNRVVAFSELPD